MRRIGTAAIAMLLAAVLITASAPWLTEARVQAVVNRYVAANNRNYSDYGVNIRCSGCGVKQIRWTLFGRKAVVDYQTGGGLLPPGAEPDRTLRETVLYITCLGTVHEAGGGMFD